MEEDTAEAMEEGMVADTEAILLAVTLVMRMAVTFRRPRQRASLPAAFMVVPTVVLPGGELGR